MANEFRKVTDQNGVDHPVCDDNRVNWASYAKTGVHQRFDFNNVISGKEILGGTANSFTVNNATSGSWIGTVFLVNVTPNTNYKIKTNVTKTSGVGFINVSPYPSGSGFANSGTISESKTVSFTFNSGNNSQLKITCFCTGDTAEIGNFTYADFTISDVLDTYDGFTDYAMTNKELTEKKIDKSAILLNASNDLDDIKNENQVGYYRWESAYPVNSPENKTWSIMQMIYYGGGVKQIVYYGSDNMYMRLYVSSTWSSWYKFTGTVVS